MTIQDFANVHKTAPETGASSVISFNCSTKTWALFQRKHIQYFNSRGYSSCVAQLRPTTPSRLICRPLHFNTGKLITDICLGREEGKGNRGGRWGGWIKKVNGMQVTCELTWRQSVSQLTSLVWRVASSTGHTRADVNLRQRWGWEMGRGEEGGDDERWRILSPSTPGYSISPPSPIPMTTRLQGKEAITHLTLEPHSTTCSPSLT